MSCIILHVLIYINQPEVGTNFMVINFLESLAFKNFEFCPHSAFMCFVCISEQAQIIYLRGINIWVSTTEKEGVYYTMVQQTPSGPRHPHYRGFIITLRHTTPGRTPLYEWSARRRDLYLTTHNTHKRQASMPPAEFELTTPASERPKTNALERAANGIGKAFSARDDINIEIYFWLIRL
jgi:hypothetical protein